MSQLEQRGIAESAKKAGWVGNDTKQRYEYPVWGIDGKVIATRTKAYDSKAAMKYGWLPSKPDNTEADWYLLPGTKHHIKVAGGMAFLANGEAAVLAFHAAGIHNVIATCHGENTVPKNTVEYLRAIGVNSLINIPDKDEAGVKAAAKWRDTLLNTDIGYQAKQWPDYLPEKSDFNDLWIHVAFDAQAARKALNECQALILPQPAVKTPKQAGLERGETPSSLIDALASALRGRGHNKQNKEWLNGLSVMRPEQNASAGMSIKTGWYYDFGTGESYPPKELAAALGINPDAFYPEKPKTGKRPDSSLSLHETPNAKKDAWALEIEQELETSAADKPAEIPKGQAAFIKLDNPVKDESGDSQGYMRSRQTPELMYAESIYPAPIRSIPEKELMYKIAAYPSGYYIGWIDQEDLPIAWIKALLHLCYSNSAVPVYAIRFHRAVRKGLINPKGFTVTDVMEALGSPRPSTDGFIEDSLEFHLFMELDTYSFIEDSVNTSPMKKSKGRPAIYYAVNEDTEWLIDHLMDLYMPCLLEKLCPDELAPITESMRDAIGMDYNEWLDYLRNHEGTKQQAIARLIDEKLLDLFKNRAHYDFSDADLETPAKLRGKIATLTLNPYSERIIPNGDGTETVIPRVGIQLSKAKLALELGCSESSLAKLFADNNIGSKRIYGWVEVPNANGADIDKELREAPTRLNHLLGGVSIGIVLTVWDKGKETRIKLSYADKARENFRKWDGRIIRMDIFVEQPSLLWNMTASEIAEKKVKDAKKAAEKAVEKAEATEVSENAQNAPKIAPEATEDTKPKAPRRPVFSRGKDRTWKGHSPEWLQEQMALRVHVYTDSYRLDKLTILSNEGRVVATLESYAALMTWLKVHGSKEVKRSVYSFYHPEKVAKPAPVAQPVPVKVAAPALEDEGINWAENVELFYERMRALGG